MIFTVLMATQRFSTPSDKSDIPSRTVSILALSIWLIVAKRLNVFSLPAVVGSLSLAMIFHALYNLLVSEPGASSVIGYLLPLLTAILLFLFYRKLQNLPGT